jgi:hypothetical protein
MELDKGWGTQSEKVVNNIMNTSIGYKHMFHMASDYYSNLNFYLIVLIYIINSIITMWAVFNIVIPYKYYNIIILLLSILELLFITINDQGEYNKKESDYKLISSKYSALANNITRQMLLSRGERENMSDYITWICKTYDQLYEMTPVLPERLIKKYKKYAEQTQLPIPEKNINECILHINQDSIFRNTDELEGRMKFELQRLKNHNNQK